MSVKFLNYDDCYYDNADFLDDATSFSIASWIRMDTITVGSWQGIWSHYGGTNRIYLRKNDGTPELFRLSITSGGVNVTIDDTTGAPVAGTVYHIGITWIKGIAGGLNIYRNGTHVTSASTATQTANYHSGGAVDFYVGALRSAISYGKCTVEGLTIWKDYILSATEMAALYRVGWPHLISAPRPTAFWPFQEGNARASDLSGNGRHITIFESSPVADVTIGHWEDPDQPGTYTKPGTPGSGPPEPNPWTLFGSTTHPIATSTITGLVNDTTYEVKVNAVDTSDNESVDSDILEVTPAASAGAIHVPRHVFIGH